MESPKYIFSYIKKYAVLSSLFGACLLFLPQTALAKKAPEIYTGALSKLAVQGYDTVAYFTEGKPIRGEKNLETTYKGAVWRFSNEKNLQAFKEQPEKYTPQYGGYCAWAVAAKKELVKGSARHWKIVDQKLYLNYNNTIQKRWEKNMSEFIKQADQEWPAILEK